MQDELTNNSRRSHAILRGATVDGGGSNGD
jgi:hypothetical protein